MKTLIYLINYYAEFTFFILRFGLKVKLMPVLLSKRFGFFVSLILSSFLTLWVFFVNHPFLQ